MTETSLREAPLVFRSALEEGHPERGTDTLRLLPWAEALRDFVHTCDTPMTVGIQGDWGIIDGVDTPALFRPSNDTFYFRHTLTQGIADHEFVWTGGGTNWLPVSGDFNLK